MAVAKAPSSFDLNKCIGCGLCTTRCQFDAIHLQRDLPDASRMYRCEDKIKAVLPSTMSLETRCRIIDIMSNAPVVP